MTLKDVLVKVLKIRNTTIELGDTIRIAGETMEDESIRFLVGKHQIEISINGEVHAININEITELHVWDYRPTDTEIFIRTKFSDIRLRLKTGEVEEGEDD